MYCKQDTRYIIYIINYVSLLSTSNKYSKTTKDKKHPLNCICYRYTILPLSYKNITPSTAFAAPLSLSHLVTMAA